jgi:hypothetical protein
MSVHEYCIDEAEAFIETMCKPPLLHGEQDHKDWLIKELTKYTVSLANLIEEVYELGYEDAKEKLRTALR